MALENVVTFPSAEEETGLDHLGIQIDRTRDKDYQNKHINYSRITIVIKKKTHPNKHMQEHQLLIVMVT